MGFFERPDPRVVQSADPTPPLAVVAALKRHMLAFAICFLASAGAYAANVCFAGASAAARSNATPRRNLERSPNAIAILAAIGNRGTVHDKVLPIRIGRPIRVFLVHKVRLA